MAGYVKLIMWFGEPAAVACDGKCNKAWGINNRPKVQLSDDPDDYESLADDELPDAPANPGTYEGECAKPIDESERLNKWCIRECERSQLFGHLEKARNGGAPEVLPDYSVRRQNMSHEANNP